ncbi:MAG: flavodoxin domain-containing protein [Candidatus Bathyarchaeota archaeon]|nr:flavodoxin domain-containing protein [Candidatus Bathyarchaeota archaeon]MDT8781323.1 flavodoxin domain-containing protein [Candidatus Bathyarchaeota archaeon]
MVKVSLKDGVNWVGVVDWNIRDFHGYTTKRGSSYNAYLILDEKIALVDTVKAAFSQELIEHISELTTLDKIDYIVVNHVEMDHSSSLPVIAKLAKNAKILATARGKEELIKHFGSEFERVEVVKSGDKINLGKKTITFMEAPMLHWPDSMFTYLIEDKILLPNDAFGQHLASYERFDDEVDQQILMEEAKTYYANILTPFSPLIVKKIQEVVAMKLPIDIIAPSHGIIWRKDPMKIVNTYMDLCTGKTVKQKAIVVFDTMWGSTDKMARAIGEGLASQGFEVKLLKLRATDNTDIVTEIVDAKIVLVGSPTLNNGMFPSVGSFLTYIGGLKPKGKLWGFFGSYGWGGGATRGMIKMAKEAGFDVMESSIELKWVPTAEELKKCFEFGQETAQKIKA